MTDSPDAESLAAAIREELVQLWGDMFWARRDAHNGCWSIRCENLADRIVELSRLVGPTHWGDLDVNLVLDGVYEKVYREAGIEPPPVHWEAARAHAARIEEGARRV